jgi:hypothetical protein
LIAGLFPTYEERWLEKVTAELCYHRHGGSGLSFSRSEIREMPIDEIEFYLEWLEDMRRREAEAMKKANQTARR